MNFLITAAGLYIPAFIKKQKIQDLIKITAQAFQTTSPETNNLSYPECLHVFARFSNEMAQTAINKNDDIQAIKIRLYSNARVLGQTLRRQFHIQSPHDIIVFSRILYKIIGIDFSCTPAGEATIRRCYFSQFFNSEVCRIFSAFDEGVAAGLSNGGQLQFSGRITEGKDCCHAQFRFPEALL